MKLEKRPVPYLLPTYSLTGDMLAYLRCPLQYRYYNGSSLPPSRPVQLWFGQFIHGVMEESYRRFSSGSELPWPDSFVNEISDTIKARLAARGLISRSFAAEEMARRRAFVAVNEIGPHLFPLVAMAEVRLQGTRKMPKQSGFKPRAERYEIDGVVDVLTDVSFKRTPAGNRIVEAIKDRLPDRYLRGEFEAIVDYKGMARPRYAPADNLDSLWVHHEWQMRTYAWLREKQPGSRIVIAGVLIYINELLPSRKDIADLKKDIKKSPTDVTPVSGTPDARNISNWRRGQPVPDLSLDFRFARALRIVTMERRRVRDALKNFDNVVGCIERCVYNERTSRRIIGNWPGRREESTCVACDSKYFCSDSPECHAPYAP